MALYTSMVAQGVCFKGMDKVGSRIVRDIQNSSSPAFKSQPRRQDDVFQRKSITTFTLMKESFSTIVYVNLRCDIFVLEADIFL